VAGRGERPGRAAGAGDQLYQVSDQRLAKDIADETRQQRRAESLEALRKPRTLEELLAADDQQQVPELNLIVKADVQGSVDVLKKTLSEFPTEKANLRLLHTAVGAITEADVQLARASDAIVIGFHVVRRIGRASSPTSWASRSACTG